ncbi:MAG: ABC transporter substrate-binding protein [bacterium]|nr:ABC transporter substrate-binding protein [bacterium]
MRFGFLHPQSGDYAFLGQPSLDGARAAIGEINANGGVLGREVELVVEDSLSTAAGAVAGYNRISPEIDALGGLELYGAISLLNAVNGDEMPTMCPMCGTSELGVRGGLYMWGLTASFNTNGVVAAQLARDLGYTRVALLVRAYPWLDTLANRFRGAWEYVVGGEITADVRIVSTLDGYSAKVQQVIEGDPEALFVVPGYDEGAAVMSEVIDSGYEGTILVSSYLAGNEIAELVAGLPEGRVLSAHVTNDVESPAYAAFTAAHLEHAGKLPPGGFYEANQYDQYIALALAMTAAGSVEGPAVAAQVPQVLSAPGTKVYTYADGVAALERGEDIDYDGASSSLDMNEAGDLISPMISVTQNANGQWYQRDVIRLDPNLVATAPVRRPPVRPSGRA